MMTNLNETLNTLFRSEAFVAEAKRVTTIEEMQKLAAKYGVCLTEEEVVEMCRTIAEQLQADGELSEEALENVAGGVWGWVVVGVVSVGAFALGVYNGYKG